MSDASSGAGTDICHRASPLPTVPSPRHTNTSGGHAQPRVTPVGPSPAHSEARTGYSVHRQACPLRKAASCPCPAGLSSLPGPNPTDLLCLLEVEEEWLVPCRQTSGLLLGQTNRGREAGRPGEMLILLTLLFCPPASPFSQKSLRGKRVRIFSCLPITGSSTASDFLPVAPHSPLP